MRYRDRIEAGQQLVEKLMMYANRPDVLVLALPRGGVPVGFAVAEGLHAALDVFLVRKLGVPGRKELAMGAIATGGVRVLNEQLVAAYRVDAARVDRVAEAERRELERRERAYREGRPPPDLRGGTAILVDDGLATGSTMRAAIAAVRLLGPARVVVAVPTAPVSTAEELGREADEVACVSTPPRFRAVGLSYREFPQVGDEEVRELLARARASSPGRPAHAVTAGDPRDGPGHGASGPGHGASGPGHGASGPGHEEATVPENELARVFEASGPFASIYLTTSGDVENAAQRVALRWKNLRGELARAGVPEATLEAIDPLVEGSHTAGACLAVITAVDGVVWS